MAVEPKDSPRIRGAGFQPAARLHAAMRKAQERLQREAVGPGTVTRGVCRLTVSLEKEAFLKQLRNT